jgi:hypothetical protein
MSWVKHGWGLAGALSALLGACSGTSHLVGSDGSAVGGTGNAASADAGGTPAPNSELSFAALSSRQLSSRACPCGLPRAQSQ